VAPIIAHHPVEPSARDADPRQRADQVERQSPVALDALGLRPDVGRERAYRLDHRPPVAGRNCTVICGRGAGMGHEPTTLRGCVGQAERRETRRAVPW
jgi:hypothetical protein